MTKISNNERSKQHYYKDPSKYVEPGAIRYAKNSIKKLVIDLKTNPYSEHKRAIKIRTLNRNINKLNHLSPTDVPQIDFEEFLPAVA